MLIKDQTLDQSTSLDHQCDLGASISHYNVRTVERQGPVNVKGGERRGAEAFWSWGADGPVR